MLSQIQTLSASIKTDLSDIQAEAAANLAKRAALKRTPFPGPPSAPLDTSSAPPLTNLVADPASAPSASVSVGPAPDAQSSVPFAPIAPTPTPDDSTPKLPVNPSVHEQVRLSPPLFTS